LFTYMVAESYRKSKKIEVYTNMDVSGWKKIKSLDDLLLDYKPKILVLDEVYYFLDSRNWKDNTAPSLFFNTIGKQNILLMITAISPEMVEKRIREQLNYVALCKGDSNYINIKLLDVIRNKAKVIRIKKSEELFSKIRYNTLQVPDYVD